MENAEKMAATTGIGVRRRRNGRRHARYVEALDLGFGVLTIQPGQRVGLSMHLQRRENEVETPGKRKCRQL